MAESLSGRRLGAVFVLTSLLSACIWNNQTHVLQGSTQPTLEPPISGFCKQTFTSESPSGNVNGHLRVAAVSTFTAPDLYFGGLTTWGHYFAWTQRARGTKDPNRVMICDLETGTLKAVAGSGWPKGNIPWVTGTKDAIVYSDYERADNDYNQASPWVLYELNLNTGRKLKLAASHPHEATPREQAFSPRTYIEWPWAADQTNPPGSRPLLPRDVSGDVSVYDLRTGRKRVLVSKSDTGGDISIDGGIVYYSAPSSPKQRNIFSVPADGSGQPQQVTTSGAVHALAANGTLVWLDRAVSEPDEAGARTVQNKLWTMPTDGKRPPVHFADGVSSFPGKGFVMWGTWEGHLLTSDPYSPDEPLLLEEHLHSGDFDAFGDRAVWATSRAVTNQSPIIHVARIVKN